MILILPKRWLLNFFGSLVVFTIFLIYFFGSTFPHGFKNLKGASYPYYKANKITSDEAVFLYKREYETMLSELNIRKDKQKDLILAAIESPKNKGSYSFS